MTDYDPLSPACLEAIEARIGEVTVENANIFDPDDPEENNLLFRTANRLHIRTLQGIIRRQLLFKPGDLYSHPVRGQGIILSGLLQQLVRTT